MIVDEASNDDNSGKLVYALTCVLDGSKDTFTVASLNPATMELLGLFRGDTVLVRYAICVLSKVEL